MFCTNCGREIIDTARFCNFCGTPIQNMAAGIPVQPAQPVQPVYPQPAPEYSESTSIPVTENISEEAVGTVNAPESLAETENAETTETTAENTADTAIPAPNTIPTIGSGEPMYSAPPAYPTPSQNMGTIPVQSAELIPESKPERRYTLGHIMMCLAAVAIMAIVAGVFAGLYFSVV